MSFSFVFYSKSQVIGMDETTGRCIVLDKSNDTDNNLQPQDIIVSLNGIKLTEVENAGVETWVALLNENSMCPRTVVICRAPPPAPQIVSFKSRIVFLLLVSSPLLLLAVFTSRPHVANKLARSIKVRNDSGRPIQIFWVQPDTGEMILQMHCNPIVTKCDMNSFVGHTFEVQEVPTEDTGVCGGDHGVASCSVGRFTVNYRQDQGG